MGAGLSSGPVSSVTMLEDLTTAASPAWPAAYPQGYAVVDVETTGLARDDRIISAAVYRLDARGEVEDHWYTMVNPERGPGPVWIHGLTTEVLEGAPLFQDIAGVVRPLHADRVLVAHNAVFNWSMMARRIARAEREAPVRQRLRIALSRSWACRCQTTSWSHWPRTSVSYSSGRTTRWTTRAGAGRGVPAESAGRRAGRHPAAAPGVPQAAEGVVREPRGTADRTAARFRWSCVRRLPVRWLPVRELAAFTQTPRMPLSQPGSLRSGQTTQAGYAGQRSPGTRPSTASCWRTVPSRPDCMSRQVLPG